MTSPEIDCAEFQEHLPELFTAGHDGSSLDPALQQHLDTCDNCSALVRDLRYIADQAKSLLQPALEEPSDHVWSGIQSRLKDAVVSDDLE